MKSKYHLNLLLSIGICASQAFLAVNASTRKDQVTISQNIQKLKTKEPDVENNSLCREVKNDSPNTTLRTFKGRASSLFRALGCLPKEENFISINRKGQKNSFISQDIKP